MKREVTCIVCPKGCKMLVSNINAEYIVEGNTCIRGSKYGVDEVTNPKRVITSTVKLEGSYLNMLPVKTNGSVPKEKMFEIMEVLANIEITAPVSVGDIIVKDVSNTGVDIVSCKTMKNTSRIYNEGNLQKAL